MCVASRELAIPPQIAGQRRALVIPRKGNLSDGLIDVAVLRSDSEIMIMSLENCIVGVLNSRSGCYARQVKKGKNEDRKKISSFLPFFTLIGNVPLPHFWN